MENFLIAFLNARTIFPQNNLSFDQTKKEFPLMSIRKTEPISFALYFIKELFRL